VLKRANASILLGTALIAAFSCEAGKFKGIKMEEKLEKLALEYGDLFTKPREERTSELDFKIADMEWEGIYLAAPASVDASENGIPVMAFMKRDDLDEWKVRIRKNSFLVFTNLDRGNTGITPLHKPPEKKMKPQPDIRGRKPEAGEGYSAGAVRRVIGDAQSESMAKGDYVISLISYDRISNQCRVEKKGKPETPVLSIADAEWPWKNWADTTAFENSPSSPALSKDQGIALAVGERNGVFMVFGTVAAKARDYHLIPPDPDRKVNSGVQAGIHVDLILVSLDRYPPDVVRLSVPIMCSGPLHVGDAMSGWFSAAFPFKPSEEERVLYAIADGEVVGPVPIPGITP